MQRKKTKILIVDDENDARELITDVLKDEGYLTDVAKSGEEALEKVKDETFGIVILDLVFPAGMMNGLEILKELKKEHPNIYVIILTAHGTIEGAVKAVKEGAYDFIRKPFDNNELVIKIANAIEKFNLIQETEYLRQEIQKKYNFSNIIGKSYQIQDVFKMIKKITSTITTVLIQSETGTGKELVAYAIHYNSPRTDKPFIVVDCAAIPSTILESELFGVIANYPGFHNKETLVGKFELADGGTIFFDEIGDMALELQAKILRVFENKEVAKLGEKHPKKVDVRIICATNKSLRGEIEKGNFREDLFQRINVFPISLPPLRERKEDIPLLIQYFIERYAKETKNNVSRISDEALELLRQYDYPGNIRELENLIERAVILTEGDTIPLEALPTDLSNRRKLDTSTKSRVLDSDTLPSLAEVLSLYDAPSYIKIPNLEVQKKVFLKTFIQGKGTLEDVKDKLDISHGAVHEHFRLVRETIFVLLCRHQGNIENLAKSWHVSSQDLQVTLSKKNRLLKFVAGIMKDYGEDEQKTAHRFNVTLDEFREAFRRLRELSRQ